MIETRADLFQTHGVLPHLTCDRDPRFVGSASDRDFPSVFVRFLYALNVEIHIYPPHRPNLNSHVERYHKSFGQECVAVQKPGDLTAVREMLPGYIQHDNADRPKHAVTCGNHPSRASSPESAALNRPLPCILPVLFLQCPSNPTFNRVHCVLIANGSACTGCTLQAKVRAVPRHRPFRAILFLIVITRQPSTTSLISCLRF